MKNWYNIVAVINGGKYNKFAEGSLYRLSSGMR